MVSLYGGVDLDHTSKAIWLFDVAKQNGIVMCHSNGQPMQQRKGISKTGNVYITIGPPFTPKEAWTPNSHMHSSITYHFSNTTLNCIPTNYLLQHYLSDIDHFVPLYNTIPIKDLFNMSSCESRPRIYFDVSDYHPPFCQAQTVCKGSKFDTH